MQNVEVVHQYVLGSVVVTVDDVLDLGIDSPRRVIRHMLGLGHRAAEEHLALLFGIQHRAHLFGHAPLSDHLAGDIGGPFDVVGGSGRHLLTTIDDLFGNPTTIEAGDHRLQILLGVAPAILLGQIHGDTQSATTRDDRDLINRIVIRHHTANDGMSCLVIGRHLLFTFRHDHRLALGAHHDLVFRPFKLGHADQTLV